ncbi:hypothetical protein SeLEV6574_g03103 [Synchytrium endobioticum]|uniref:RING-type domain-containing protein n=1 Tax=Synchytrium endobioticum TaxID=286115 RepID=A0A507D5Q1_9FUNG|nr:hypothetical protein SeLEV6574_g03103 [Synchytrium endobioticum]
MRSNPHMPTKQLKQILALVVFQLMVCAFNPASAMDGRDIVPSGSAGRHGSRGRHGRMGSSYGGNTRDAIGHGDMGGSSGVSGMNERYDMGTSQHGASSSRHDTPPPPPMDLAKFTGILKVMEEQCDDSINQCERKVNALQSLAKDFKLIFKASQDTIAGQSESEIQDGMIRIVGMLRDGSTVNSEDQDSFMAAASEWMDAIVGETERPMDLADLMRTLKSIEEQGRLWYSLCQKNAKRLQALVEYMKRIIATSRNIIARQSKFEIQEDVVIIIGMLDEAIDEIVEWTKTVQDPVMAVARKRMDLTVRILDGRMDLATFAGILEELGHLCSSWGRHFDILGGADDLQDDLERMETVCWDIIQAKSESGIQKDMTAVFKLLHPMMKRIDKLPPSRIFKLRNSLSNFVCRLEGRELDDGPQVLKADSRTSPCPICYEPLEPAMKAGIQVLLCGHLFHKNCVGQWLDISKTCPTCRAEIPYAATS